MPVSLFPRARRSPLHNCSLACATAGRESRAIYMSETLYDTVLCVFMVTRVHRLFYCCMRSMNGYENPMRFLESNVKTLSESRSRSWASRRPFGHRRRSDSRRGAGCQAKFSLLFLHESPHIVSFSTRPTTSRNDNILLRARRCLRGLSYSSGAFVAFSIW